MTAAWWQGLAVWQVWANSAAGRADRTRRTQAAAEAQVEELGSTPASVLLLRPGHG